MDIFKFRTTPGIGDAMFAMNVAHNWSHQNKKQVELHLYWSHNKEYNYHFEDPETIVERVDYIHKFYYKSKDVIIKHFYNMNDVNVNHYRMTLNDKLCIHHEKYKSSGFQIDTYPTWCFDEKFKQKTNKDMVVVWRSLFNVEEPRWWKRLTNDKLISSLKEQNLTVIEISYRTPIREVLYYINICDFVVGYDGMWHYVARNFFKPMLIISSGKITRLHNPNAWNVSNGKEHNYLNFIKDLFNFKRINTNNHKEYFETNDKLTTNYELLHNFNDYHKRKFENEVLNNE